MKVKKILSIFLIVLAISLFVPAYALAIPALPHCFYGSLTVNRQPANVGYTVEARGEGVLTGIIGVNPLITNEVGMYGSEDSLGQKLAVQGDIEDGALIEFYVNGVKANEVAYWHSEAIDRLDLTVTISSGGGGGGALRYYIATNLLGIEERYRTSLSGELRETIEATSEDGNLTITIEEGTIALAEDGYRLRTLEVSVDETPPLPPEDAHIIGLAYSFEPDGATFDPEITLEFTYDPADIPEDVAEEDLVVAYYDEDAGEWVELTCTVDTEENTVTAFVDHFTTFAIIGTVTPAPAPAPAPADFTLTLGVSPAEVALGGEVTITVSVANTGGTEGSYTVVLKINDVKEAEKDVTVAAGKSRDVSFTVTREEVASYSVAVDGQTGSFTVVAPAPPAPAPAPAPAPTPAKAINWPVLGGIIGGVIVIGLLIFFLIRRRAY